MFTGVCLSTGGGAWSTGEWVPGPGGVWSRGGLVETPRMAPAADGTHPTGMHSCLSSVFRLSLHQCKNLKKTISLVQQNDLNRDLISIENSMLAKLLTMHCNKYTVLPLLNLASMYFYSNEWHMPYYLQNHFAINTPTFTSCVHRRQNIYLSIWHWKENWRKSSFHV